MSGLRVQQYTLITGVTFHSEINTFSFVQNLTSKKATSVDTFTEDKTSFTIV